MARALDLGGLLRLGRGEELTGGRQKASLLADAMEAVIAAVFVEGGLGPVLAIVDRFLGEAFARASSGTLDRDFKTQLQELAQSRLRATPRYRVVAEHGPDHSKVFDVETDVRGEVVGRGSGRSKKDAEQAAAKLALDALGRRFAPEPPPEAPVAVPPAPAEVAATAPAQPDEAEPAARPARRAPKRSRPAATSRPRTRAKATGAGRKGGKAPRSPKARAGRRAGR
jgi:ribonuclease-3